jgi:hypothetical protein
VWSEMPLGDEGAELILSEKCDIGLGLNPRSKGAIWEITDMEICDDGCEFLREECILSLLKESQFHLLRQLIDMIIYSFESIEFLEEVLCFFGTKSIDPRNIIRCITDDSEIIPDLVDWNSEFFENIRFFHELAFHRIIDMYMPITDKLTEILV